MSFGEELHRLRTEAGISIPDLAARTGIFSDYLAEIESGQWQTSAGQVEGQIYFGSLRFHRNSGLVGDSIHFVDGCIRVDRHSIRRVSEIRFSLRFFSNRPGSFAWAPCGSFFF